MAIKKVIASLMLFVPVLSSIEPVFAQGKQFSRQERLERFYLFTNCEPLYLLVEYLPEDARRLNLSRTDIILAAESRLRSARIFTDKETAPTLYINVNVVGLADSVHFELKKVLYDLDSQEFNFGATWRAGVTGLHGGQRDNILNAVDDLMDRFLVEYLRVNESACDRK